MQIWAGRSGSSRWLAGAVAARGSGHFLSLVSPNSGGSKRRLADLAFELRVCDPLTDKLASDLNERRRGEL